MRCTVRLAEEVKDALRALPLDLHREIGHRRFLLEDDLAGNVKKLRGSKLNYRLRAGEYRVLFALEGTGATV